MEFGKQPRVPTIFIAGRFLTLGSVNTPTWVEHWCHSSITRGMNERTLVALMFFRSIPTSRVTPSPNLKLAAATSKAYSFSGGGMSTGVAYLRI